MTLKTLTLSLALVASAGLAHAGGKATPNSGSTQQIVLPATHASASISTARRILARYGR